MPPGWGVLTAEAQARDDDSMLSLYRRALRLRRGVTGELTWDPAPEGSLAFRRDLGDRQLLVLVNLSADPVRLPPGEVLLASAELAEGALPRDTAVWLAV